MIKFSQILNTPLNLKKPCLNYPNEDFGSYEECDLKFVRESIMNLRNITPFWVTRNFSDVTKIAISDTSKPGYDYMKYVMGDKNSPCSYPCLLTKVKKLYLKFNQFSSQIEGVQTSRSGRKSRATMFQLQFEDSVDITEFYYPEFSITNFLSNIGGSLGLWLGLGVLQFTDICSTIIALSQSYIKKRISTL